MLNQDKAKYLPQNSNPMVVVKVGKKKKRTVVRKGTDSPYFNEYFAFNFTGDFNVFLGTKISILVYLKKCLHPKFHGGTFLEVATVWEEPGHEYYHKWAILTNPKDPTGGTKGYVKCNISVNAKGEMIRIRSDNEGHNDIEGNLLLPLSSFPVSGRQQARYIFAIYRADGLPYADSILCTGNPKKTINPYIQISFAGLKNKLWAIEEYVLVGIIYDACMLDRCRFMMKSVSFEINFGNIGSQSFPNDIESSINHAEEVVLDNRPILGNRTAPKLIATTDGKFNHLPLGSNKPCESDLAKLETLITVKSRMAYENYNRIIGSLKRYCINYLHILDSERYNLDGGTTKLDRHRVNVCRECIEDVVKMIESNGDLPNNNFIKIATAYAYKYLQKIRKICEDPQQAFPDVFIWMIVGTRRVALARLKASEIIYSEMDLSRGVNCGKRINLFMKNIDDNTDTPDYGVCNIEIFLWLGNAKFSSACWSFIPTGYQVEHWSSIESFPKSFIYTTSTKFQLRAHIFQGRFESGLDSTGLMDPFIRIIFRGYTASTKSIKQSLAPVWDETLVLEPIDLYGSKESIKSLPPSVIVEAFDQDSCGIKEFYGRCVIKPIVKLMEESYSSLETPPILMWHAFTTKKNFEGGVLAAFELIEVTSELIDYPSTLNEKTILSLPDDIRPVMISHRMEIIFWGVRDMKKINNARINKPRIVIECCGIHVNSEVMENAKKFSNFRENHVIIDLDLPQQQIYYPPLTIKIYNSSRLERFTYAGVCIIPSSHIFYEELLTEEEYYSKINEDIKDDQIDEIIHQQRHSSIILPLPSDYSDIEENRGATNFKKLGEINFRYRMSKMSNFIKTLLLSSKGYQKHKYNFYGNDENENNNWWTKYFASIQKEKNDKMKGNQMQISSGQKEIATFKIYQSELEMQPEFHKFHDKLKTFALSRGKMTGDIDHDAKNYAGKFKGNIAIYQWPHPQETPCRTKNGNDVANGLLVNYPPQGFVKLLIRIYIIKGINLHPCDVLTGTSDPYLVIKLGKNYISDSKNYIPNQSNPIFGRSFEMEAYLPRDHTLTIQVWDHDKITTDDLIGETKIDIENRYYSEHRGQCGLSKTYSTCGYNSWRDVERPTQILQSLCMKNNLPMPEISSSCVTIGKQKFFSHTIPKGVSQLDYEECLALNVLHQWQLYPICGAQLVPEHIERRSLFNIEKSGLEQIMSAVMLIQRNNYKGKLELWVDMFRIDELPPKPLVDITPQVPEDYELRVIIWNTEDVPLVDNQFLTGEKCSDIYVKGWILYEDYQSTDVHYNSLTGEGNFNWRFIFHFTHAKSENFIIVRKKLFPFSIDETEQKLPCKLHLQVWDSDHFSPDDFLVVVTLQGKVEMELTLVPTAEAKKMPVGMGRNPPNPLPFPKVAVAQNISIELIRLLFEIRDDRRQPDTCL
ncbi:hypothetical protein PV326_012519 [Microctonus aethiopoides]|nr:hypothetical protein PV326_012519 [Microctonus aethiopoides]